MKKLALAGVIAAMALTLGGCDLITAGSEDVKPRNEMKSKPDESGPDRD